MGVHDVGSLGRVSRQADLRDSERIEVAMPDDPRALSAIRKIQSDVVTQTWFNYLGYVQLRNFAEIGIPRRFWCIGAVDA